MASVDGVEQIVLNLLGHLSCRRFNVLNEELYVLFDGAILVVEQSAPLGYGFLQSLNVLLRQCEHSLALERYGVAHVAAVPCGEACSVLGDCLMYKTCHELVGIAASLVNLQARVSALQSLDNNLDGSVVLVGLHFLIFECGCDVDTACRTDNKLAPCLRVEIEQNITVEFALGQVVGTEHTSLLVGSDESLNGSVNEGLVLHNGHYGSHTDTVVGAESGSLSLNPFAVYVCLDRVGLEVVCALVALLRHHVHVSLQNDALAVFHSWRSGLTHHYITSRILECLNAYTSGKLKQHVLYFFKMSRRARHLCQCVKVAPDTFGVQVFDFTHNYCFY